MWMDWSPQSMLTINRQMQARVPLQTFYVVCFFTFFLYQKTITRSSLQDKKVFDGSQYQQRHHQPTKWNHNKDFIDRYQHHCGCILIVYITSRTGISITQERGLSAGYLMDPESRLDGKWRGNGVRFIDFFRWFDEILKKLTFIYFHK